MDDSTRFSLNLGYGFQKVRMNFVLPPPLTPDKLVINFALRL